METINGNNKRSLEGLWDEARVLRNPHKGWYQHYYDNTVEKYLGGDGPDDFLMDFPGLNHIYLRLAWAYLEPQEGQFDWEVIDRVIEPWRAHGYTISFRISCKETDLKQVYATPEWVKDAGCKGRFTNPPWDGNLVTWEPDYGDPVFLEKLDAFHSAFADRYDGKPWVEYIDVGSFGDWGEGHTWAGSQLYWPLEVLERHLEIHERHYKRSLLCTNYSFTYNGNSFKHTPETKAYWDRYFVDRGYAIRNDSISVKFYEDHYGPSTLQDPRMFDGYWPTRPVILELEHYSNTLKSGAWKGGRALELALEESHAAFIGHHGYARQFLLENPDLTRRLANRCGYWYFPKAVAVAGDLLPGQPFTVAMDWANKGVAPSYHRFDLEFVLTPLEPGEGMGSTILAVPETQTDNRLWGPDSVTEEAYTLRIPEGTAPGRYSLGLRMSDASVDDRRIVELGLREGLRTADGTYIVGDVPVG